MFKKVAMNLGLRWLGGQAREIAEGKQGPGAQKIYLWFVGKKRPIGVILLLYSIWAVAAGYPGAAVFVGGPLAALFLSLGFIDKNWREVPRYDSPWLRFLRQYALDIAGLMAALTATVSQCDPWLLTHLPSGITCDHLVRALAGVSAVFVHLGISAEAQISQPPVLIKRDEPRE